MAKRKKIVRQGKKSRFSLSARGERVLVVVGLLTIAAVLFLVWTTVAPHVFKPDAARQAKDAQREARWASLLKDGVVLRFDEKRQDLFVDSARWADLGLDGQSQSAEAAMFHFHAVRCFIYAAGTGEEIAWYTEADGYKVKERENGRTGEGGK